MSKIRIKGDTSDYVDLTASATGGKLGIGTDTPDYDLTVEGSSHPRIKINSTNNTASGLFMTVRNSGTLTGTATTRIDETGNYSIYNGTTSSPLNMNIDASGRVTKPNQPAFLAKVNANIGNLSVNTASNVDIPITNEIFDLNNNFSSSTFTAPVTGKYVLGFHMRLDNIDAATTSYSLYLVTSNRTYSYIFDPDVGNDRLYYSPTLNILTEMDANDTAKMQYYVNAGAAQATLVNSTYFYGYLVA